MCERLPVPNRCRDLGLIVAEFHTHCHKALELRDKTVLKVLERADAFRRPERFEGFLIACEADARGRKGLEDREYPQADVLRAAFLAAKAVDAAAIAKEAGPERVAEQLRRARIAAIRGARKNA